MRPERPFTGVSGPSGVKIARKFGIPPTQTGPRIPIFWKRGFRGPKTPISPRPRQGSFLSKIPFSTREHREMFIFDRSYEGEGKWGFLDPEIFSRKWRFGALSGVGGIAKESPKKSVSGGLQKIPENTRISQKYTNWDLLV